MDIDEVLDGFLQGGRDAAEAIGANSQAVARSIETTLDIGERAARDLAAGNIDLTAAQRVAQRGFDQLKTAARAEGNLLAASTADWLDKLFGTVLKLIPNVKL